MVAENVGFSHFYIGWEFASDLSMVKKLRNESKARTVQVEQFEQRIKEFEESITFKDLHAVSLGNMIRSLKTEKRQLKESFANIKADRAALKKLRAETGAGAAQIHQLEETVNDLQHTLASNNSHVESLNKKNLIFEREKRQLETSATAEKPQIGANCAALKELKEKSKARKIQTNQLEERVRDLEACLASRDSHAQTLDSMIQVLEPQIDADCAALKKFRDENQGLHAQVLKSKIQTLKSEKQELNATLATEKFKVEANRVTLRKLKDETGARAARIHTLEQKIKDLEKHPSEMMEKLLTENATLKVPVM
ncbi:hypothetical protein EV359DRAFT_87965, partial [Lentinula novae-zelandiae]